MTKAVLVPVISLLGENLWMFPCWGRNQYIVAKSKKKLVSHLQTDRNRTAAVPNMMLEAKHLTHIDYVYSSSPSYRAAVRNRQTIPCRFSSR